MTTDKHLVEPAGVSEADIAAIIHSKQFEIRCDHDGKDEASGTNNVRRKIISALSEFLAARQQLAEMRGAISTARAYVARIGSQYAPYMDDMDAGSNRATVAILDRALAPTSQPSRGKCAPMKCADCGAEWPRTDRDQDGDVCQQCFADFNGMTEEELFGPDCAQPERQGADDEDGADTGNAEADRVLRRLASSDPDFDDCTAAAVLIRRLVADMRGPDGFATWKDAAIAERLKRPSPPPTDDIVAGLRNLRREISYAWTNCEDDLALLDRAIAALEKGLSNAEMNMRMYIENVENILRRCQHLSDWSEASKYIQERDVPKAIGRGA